MNPYTRNNNEPYMLPSIVCYADILGYAQQSKNALRLGKGEAFLQHLRSALSKAYARVRQRAAKFGGEVLFDVKVFTDNIVVGFPVDEPNRGHAELELTIILNTFGELQIGLAMEGFFLRGGIAYGNHYMDEDIVYGDALLDAVALDQDGGPPRIALAASAIELVRQHLGCYGLAEWAPHFETLLEDPDGTIFLNYLGEAFAAYPDGGIFFDIIEAHKRVVLDGLTEYRGTPGIRSKFEWAARYHNFVCVEFAGRHPISSDPYGDELIAAAATEAQELLNYTIDMESMAVSPARISLSPFIR